MPRIAAAAYPLSRLKDWDEWEAKLTSWIDDAADRGAEILVFPEYGGAEIASFGGAEWGEDHQGAIAAMTARLPEMEERLAAHAKHRNVWILSGSAPVMAGGKLINRAAFIGPGGLAGRPDKLLPTRWEREVPAMKGGDELSVYETPLGVIGVAICYDSEFPLIARALVEAGAKIILIPSCTETIAGYWRVRIGAMARALENQCWCVQAPLIGDNAWLEMVETNTGAAGVYGPPDAGFPADGVAALGGLNAPGWVIADCPVEAVDHVRLHGGVANHRDWPEQDERLSRVKVVRAG